MMTNPKTARAIAAVSTGILTALGIALYHLCVAVASSRRAGKSEDPEEDRS
ncbi:MAG: hypothetical protein ACPGNV_08535 [Mangrovicoccus sp.]